MGICATASEVTDEYVDLICVGCGSKLVTALKSKSGKSSVELTDWMCSKCGSNKYVETPNTTTEFYQTVRRALMMIVSWIDKH